MKKNFTDNTNKSINIVTLFLKFVSLIGFFKVIEDLNIIELYGVFNKWVEAYNTFIKLIGDFLFGWIKIHINLHFFHLKLEINNFEYNILIIYYLFLGIILKVFFYGTAFNLRLHIFKTNLLQIIRSFIRKNMREYIRVFNQMKYTSKIILFNILLLPFISSMCLNSKKLNFIFFIISIGLILYFAKKMSQWEYISEDEDEGESAISVGLIIKEDFIFTSKIFFIFLILNYTIFRYVF